MNANDLSDADRKASRTVSLDVAHALSDVPAAQLIGTDRPGDILKALDDLEMLVARHSEWLKDWHLFLVGQLDPAESNGKAAPALDLAGWCASVDNAVLTGNPAFHAVCATLAETEELAERIADRTRQDGTIPSDDYARMMSLTLQFNTDFRRLQNETWNRLANIDPLTGLGNRTAMFGKLSRECEREARNKQPCCVAIVDLDFFKGINDTHGHTAGDLVLRSVASLLVSGTRPYDQVFRYGGEEFVLCLPNTDPRSAWAIVERLRLKVANSPIAIRNGREVGITISVGVAPLTADDGVETALESADAAMYTAKAHGRNRVHVWRDERG